MDALQNEFESTSMFRRLVCGLCLAALASCSNAPRLASTGAQGGVTATRVVGADGLPRPDRADHVTGAQTYLVGVFDRLLVDVFGIEELKEREIQVDAGGRISFPMVGSVVVAGQTPGEIQATLARGLRAHYVRDPQVTVNLKETFSQFVTVEGQVVRPGQYPIPGRTTLLRALALAQGGSEYAHLTDVVVFRKVDGKNYAALYDVTAIRSGLYADPDIYADDVVSVDESRSRRLFKDFLGIIPALVTPLVVLLQRV